MIDAPTHPFPSTLSISHPIPHTTPRSLTIHPKAPPPNRIPPDSCGQVSELTQKRPYPKLLIDSVTPKSQRNPQPQGNSQTTNSISKLLKFPFSKPPKISSSEKNSPRSVWTGLEIHSEKALSRITNRVPSLPGPGKFSQRYRFSYSPILTKLQLHLEIQPVARRVYLPICIIGQLYICV